MANRKGPAGRALLHGQRYGRASILKDGSRSATCGGLVSEDNGHSRTRRRERDRHGHDLHAMHEVEDGHVPEPVGTVKLITSLPVDHAGNSVYLKGWRLPDSPNHPIIIVHDLGEHTELYRDAAHALVGLGHSSYCYDLRGHGRSGRRLGHAPSYRVLVQDLLQVAAWVRHIDGGRPPVLLGHGIGALIALDFAKSHPAFCRGLVMSAPCFELVHPMGGVAALGLRVLADMFPTLRLPSKLSPRFAKDLGRSREAHAKGALTLAVFPKLSAIFTSELLSAIQHAEAGFSDYHGPILVLCPEQDEVCKYGKIKKAALLHTENNLSLLDVDAGHEVFSGDGEARQRAIGLVGPWLSRLERPSLSRIAGASREPRVVDGFQEPIRPGASRD